MPKKTNLLRKLIRGAAFGGIAGFAASRITSSSAEADQNSIAGARIGTAVGLALAGTAPLSRNKLVRESIDAVGKIVFRRVRGRIIPIRRK